MRWVLGFLWSVGAAAPGALLACDLALLLAVDVSGSVDREEYEIQRYGLAMALRDPIVSEALVRANAQVAVMQWTGASRQRFTIPWAQINGFADVVSFAERVEKDPRIWRNYSTAIGEALQAGLAAFDEVQACQRKVMDVSGDGMSNEGIEPTELHAAFRDSGIVVNGVVIETDDTDLTAYFWENVITGGEAFVVTAAGFEDYPERIRQKLIRETTEQLAAIGGSTP